MPVDRQAAIRNAEQLLRDGDIESAVAQFSQIAGALHADGFLPRAAALYQRLLKVKADHDPSLLRLAEIAAEQGMLSDARQYLRQLAEIRRTRGDAAGADACAARYAQLAAAARQKEQQPEREPLEQDVVSGFSRTSESAEPEVRLKPDATPEGKPDTTLEEEVELTAPEEAEIELTDEVVAAVPPPDLETVFEHIRGRAVREQSRDGGAEHLERAQQLLLEGRASKAIEELQEAARTPLLRFKASAQLGRLHIQRGDVDLGIEWLERAAETPAAAGEDATAVLYDLGLALQRMGESARALGVLMELEAAASGYRDVRTRIEQLTEALAGSRPA